MMRPWMCMLLAASLAVIPLRAHASGPCCCQDEPPITANATSDAPSGCCQSHDSEPASEPRRPSKPADCPGRCDCPARCCTAMPTFAFCALAPRPMPAFRPAPPAPLPAQLSRGEDHPDRLKRPPRV